MTWSKRLIVGEAYGELALQGYEFDISPEEQQGAARKLELMVAQWSEDGINLGYLFAADAEDIDLDPDSGIQLVNVDTVVVNLALRIAAGHGKQVTVETKRRAREGYSRLLSTAATQAVTEQQMPNTLPRGAGNKPWRTANQPFMNTPSFSPLGDEGDLDFGS
jgi:hypothetical protein